MVAGGFQKVEGGALLDLLPLAHELLLDKVVGELEAGVLQGGAHVDCSKI